MNNPRDIIYHLAKNHIAPLEKELIDVESKKYHRKVIKLWNLETGEKEDCIQLLPRNDLTPIERISLSKSENSLRKRLDKYKKSLRSFPAAREADEASIATTDGSIPLLKVSDMQDTLETPVISDRQLKAHADVTAKSEELESKGPSKTEPSKSFMEKYFGRFWKK